ncbi:MAG: uroporphyrinogen-III C-methyltransferase [Coriobacteriales bacterium]|jgi:uroporphyrinogen III methyltransferase/synthase|nr:uroporphyrinogen-III C-methyltransferase [Coriobacteriales bacterium]
MTATTNKLANVIVYLVGAGPGAVDLITLKGKRCIAQADVVVYDYLSNAALLQFARPDAHQLYVGKKGFSKHVTQDQINQLLVEQAQTLAKTATAEHPASICRLKGGDPFVFGRGGEEALVLREAGVEFEIVPGVTAGIAAPAYAGIPVTHRGLSTSVAFITGNEDPRKAESDIDWAGIAQGAQTLCFYMGVRNIARIAEQLIAHGRAASEPVALVRWGTRADQEVLTGTLADIAAKVEAAHFQAPAIIVVGTVAGLRDKLAWFERRPLAGLRVAITRTEQQAHGLADKLEALGAEAVLMPTIAIEPIPGALDALDLGGGRLAPAGAAGTADSATNSKAISDHYDWLVFTSANGVRCFFDQLAGRDLDARACAGAKVAAIGPATARALAACGIRADLVPPKYVAESVLEALKKAGVQAGQRVLIPRARVAREALPEGLRQLGLSVDVLPLYQTVPSDNPTTQRALERLAAGELDAITFTSSSTARNFLKLLVAAGQDTSALANIDIYSIGPVTSRTLEQAGIVVTSEAATYTVDGLVEAILGDMAQKKER